MTGPRTSRLGLQVPALGADEELPPIPPALVEELCTLLSKALRARLLYLPNNPNYAKSAELFSAAVAPLWAHADACVLAIGEHQFMYGPYTVFKEDGQGNDSLPWLFFKDGIRELQLLPGFEQGEAEKFLDLLVRSRKALPDEDDILTLLWQGEFQGLRYRFVDVGLDGPASLEYDGDPLPTRLVDSWGETQPLGKAGSGGAVEWLDGDTEATDGEFSGGGGTGSSGDGPAGGGVGGAGVGSGTEESGGTSGGGPTPTPMAGVVNISDFDATLYFLDDREVDFLRDEIQKEYSRDHRANLVAMLLDIFELQTDPLVREEVCGLLEGYILNLLSAGQFSAVAYLLREAQVSVQRARELDASHRTRLGTLAERLSDPETLSQLLQAMDDAPDLPSQDELTDLFNQLRPRALRTVFAWLSKLSKPLLKQQLELAAGVLASQNTSELVKLIGGDDRHVTLEATRRAGALKTAAAVAPLGKVLTDGDAEQRLTAVLALSEIATPGAMQIIERMIEDPERDVRIATARAIGARAYRPALARLEAAVKGKALRDRDVTEKMATFEAYGAVAGEPGVALLDGLLNSKGFLGRREDPEIRACAAMALGRIGSAKAKESLQKAGADPKDEAVVRNAVNRALRGGTSA